MLPAMMYFAMMILCYANGKMYYGTWLMWQTLIVDIAISVSCALAIGLQLKNGRFDFSGGAIMLIAAIVAGNIAKEHQDNIILMSLICMGACILLSLVVALIYIFGRLPVIIATIGMALVYEAITCIMYGGTGINLVSNMSLRKFVTVPYVLIPLIGSILVYAFYSHLTVTGKQGTLLANNQVTAVNIGINEKKNVVISYLFSGILFGFATIIWIAKDMHNASFSSLTTVGELFSNILPVFIGMMLIKYCGDTIGIIMGALTLCLLSYGMEAVFSMELGSAITVIITGIFILLLNIISSQGGNVMRFIRKKVGIGRGEAAR